MELRHLHSFLALAEELHFGRAAERVGIAQPPLSRHIQQLEAEIGAALFERSPRAVRLTRAGEEFLLRVRPHVDGISAAITASRAAGSGLTGRLQVGFVSNLSYALLPSVLGRMKELSPDAVVDLREATSLEQVQLVRSGEIELGLVVLPVEDPGLMQRRLFQDPLVVVMPADHVLANNVSISLEELCAHPFVACPRYRRTGFQHVILDRCVEVGFQPQIVQEVEGKTLMYELIAHGVGLSVVPQSSSHGHRAGIVYRPISNYIRPVDIGAIWRRENEDPLRKLFLDTAAVVAKEIYGPKQTQAVA